MDTTPSFLSPHTLVFDFPISTVRRGSPDVVMDELEKLRRDKPDKSSGQEAAEALAEIDSLHEPVPANLTAAPLFEDEVICVECWTLWPCGTHRAIYGETKKNCVHNL